MEDYGPWIAFATALVALVTAYLDYRKNHKDASVRTFFLEHAPKAVLVIERLAAATETKKDDEALKTLVGWAEAAGHYVTPGMRKYAAGLLGGSYQEYKVEVLGIAAHEDGEEVKAAINAAKKAEAAAADPSPGSEPA